MRKLIFIFILLLSNSLYSQKGFGNPESNWTPMCDTITGELVYLEQVKNFDDCCYKWDGRNWIKDTDCLNVGLCETDCCRSNFPVGTDRNGIQNSNFNIDFGYGIYRSADSFADLQSIIESIGGTMTLECANAECHQSYIKVCGAPAKINYLTYQNNFTDPPTKEYVSFDCGNCLQPFAVQCPSQLRKYTIAYDNGSTLGSVDNDCGARINLLHWNQSYTVDYWMVNGIKYGEGYPFDNFTGWTDQLQDISDFLNIHNPIQKDTAKFGRKPARTWRYSENEGCEPYVKFGDLVVTRDSDGCRFTIHPICETKEVQKMYAYGAYDCTTNKKYIEYCDLDGTPINQDTLCVECIVTCDFKFESVIDESAVSDCTEIKDEIYCDKVEDSTTEFVAVFYFCGESIIKEFWTVESYLNAESPDDYVVYEIKGEVVDCQSGDSVIFPDPECPAVSIESECFETSKTIKASVRTSDCDIGSVEVGEEICYPITINTSENILSFVSADPLNNDVEISLVSISGTQANLEYCWISDGSTQPSNPFIIVLETEAGIITIDGNEQNTARFCINDSESFAIDAIQETELKVICYDGCPTKYQNHLGEEVKLEDPQKCSDKCCEQNTTTGFSCDNCKTSDIIKNFINQENRK